MRTALVTTTINVPNVLSLYRKYGEHVRFFVVGDHKTPMDAALFCTALDDTLYLPPSAQLHWKCSKHLGWDNDSRRNIAILEALKWGAELIITADDDMIPLDGLFFQHFESLFDYSFSGLKLGTPSRWLDPGQFTAPVARARGLPRASGIETLLSNRPQVTSVVDANIGVAQGIILGKPDTDAMNNIVNDPVITNVHEVLKTGFVADPSTYTVFNSQCTAFTRELAPAMAQFYQAEGRNTDILASVIARRVMREKNLYTHFGQPMAYHARNPHDYLHDLKAEIQGLELIDPLVEELDALPLRSAEPVTSMLRHIYNESRVLPPRACEAAIAWLQDCEGVL